MAEQECGQQTYEMPVGGWVCFFCGERFTTIGTARDHFGAAQGCEPGCALKVAFGDERGWLMELRKLEERADQQQDRALEAERELENAQCRINSLSDAMKSYRPFRACDSIQHAFHVYDSMEGRALFAEEECRRLAGLLNTPEVEDFDKAIPLEAAHQAERFGAEHDAGKSAADWFWLVGYLAGKALAASLAGDAIKAKHHCVSTAAALRNWHAHIRSGDSAMRPGLAAEKTAALRGNS